MPRARNQSRADAQQQAIPFYIGATCHHRHDGTRYTSTGACRDCVKLQQQMRRKRPADDFDSLMV